MAHTKAQGSSHNGRDSKSKRLGLKCSGGQLVKPGSIIVRQVGSRVRLGIGVGMGRDFTIFAKVAGKVVFAKPGVVSVIG